MSEQAIDPETSISMRFIRAWQPETREDFLRSVALLSCDWLGHTFVINVGEPRCNICGRANPDVTAP